MFPKSHWDLFPLSVNKNPLPSQTSSSNHTHSELRCLLVERKQEARGLWDGMVPLSLACVLAGLWLFWGKLLYSPQHTNWRSPELRHPEISSSLHPRHNGRGLQDVRESVEFLSAMFLVPSPSLCFLTRGSLTCFCVSPGLMNLALFCPLSLRFLCEMHKPAFMKETSAVLLELTVVWIMLYTRQWFPPRRSNATLILCFPRVPAFSADFYHNTSMRTTVCASDLTPHTLSNCQGWLCVSCVCTIYDVLAPVPRMCSTGIAMT